ncbi:MAG: hypothetical protein GVY36_20085 [Verrucomicrobia bacterium]|nr:hypothetical protein [Verrucomicrobiota bacterium]
MPERISDAEAELIVQAQEEEKEKEKDQRQADMLGEEIVETKVVFQGDQKIIFNRVSSQRNAFMEECQPSQSEGREVRRDAAIESKRLASMELVPICLGGMVTEEGVSDLWWSLGGERYRIVTNANFSYFGVIGEIEDGDTRYSYFSVVSPAPYQGQQDALPYVLADFTPGALEYFVIEEGSDPDAYEAIEAMLRYYAENQEKMRIAYENGQKLQKARRAYLEANPPKKRDIIVNYTKD